MKAAIMGLEDQHPGAAGMESYTSESSSSSNKQHSRVVVVAVDGSPCANYALRYAIDNVLSVERDKVVLVHAIPLRDPRGYIMLERAGCTPEHQRRIHQEAERRGLALAHAASQAFYNAKVSHEIVVRSGNPSDVICKVCEISGASMLIVGSRGLGQLSRLVVGSVSDECVHRSPCAVLVVKAPEAVRKGLVHEHQGSTIPTSSPPPLSEQQQQQQPIARMRSNSSIAISPLPADKPATGLLRMRSSTSIAVLV